MTREEFDATVGKTVFTEDWTGPRFRYGYRNRPFAMSHQPKGFIIGGLNQDFRDPAAGIRWGWIEYPFRLTDHEVEAFEMVDMNLKPEREPYRRGREPEMDLPAGKTCGDCFHLNRCCAIFGHIPADESCDWAPSRFLEVTRG